MSGFEANPEGLMDKGAAIIRIYNNYLAEKNKITKTTDEIASAWQGADSAGYVSAIHSYDSDFKKLGEVIEQMGNILTRHGARLAESRDRIKNISNRL